MNIWMVNHYANHPSFPGGTRHYELARRLVDRGFDVSIICSSFHHKTHKPAREFRGALLVEDADGVQYVWVRARFAYSTNGLGRMLNMAEFAAQVRRLGGTRFRRSAAWPDVIIGSSPDLLTARAALGLARRFGVPYVLEIRDLWPESLVEVGGFKAKHPLVRALEVLEKHLYRRADRIISLMPEAWRRIEDVGVSRDKVVWISNGASASSHANTVQAAEKHDGFRLVYLGAFGRANVLDDLLSAAKLLGVDQPGIQIALVGDGTEKERLQKRVATERIENVVFEKPVPKGEVPKLLAGADATVALLEDSPLYRYGISLNKLFDYMAAGKPVLLAGHVAHDYVELAGCGITVAPRSPEAIAEGVRMLARMSDDERESMGSKGREYLRKHHDWDLLVARLADILHELTSPHSPTTVASQCGPPGLKGTKVRLP